MSAFALPLRITRRQQQHGPGPTPILETIMRTMMKHATRVLLGLVVAGAAACGGGGDDATAPSGPPAGGTVEGSYALSHVRTLGNLGGGGNGMPVSFTDGAGHQLVFLSGTLAMASDGAFNLAVQTTYRGSPAELTDYGTYEAAGAGITFHSGKSTPRLSTGGISGNTLTANSQFGGIPFEIQLVK
jgi:hypothetical protein